MSTEITTAFKKQYSDSFELTYQQTQSILGGTVRREDQSSEMMFFDYLGEADVEWDGPRHGATPQIDTPHSRRRNTLHVARWADKIDKPDKVKTLKDPQSGYIKVGTAAIRRGEDERILEGLGATAYTGQDGGTAVTLVDESYRIMGDGTVKAPGVADAGTTETGLTPQKIAQIGAIFDDNSVPEMDRHIVCNSNQKWYLLGSTKTTSADYSGVRSLAHGEINTWMGFTFHWLPSARFAVNTTDTGCYNCYAYHRSAVMLGVGFDLNTEVDRLPTNNYSVQVFAEMMMGSTRLQGLGVVGILLKKDPGIDFTLA